MITRRFIKQFFPVTLMFLTACGVEQVSSGVNGDVRLEAVKQAALTYGSQSALAWNAQIINAVLKSHETTLDQIYNFNRLQLSSNLTPPVIEKSDNSLALDDPNTIRSTGQVYRIIKPAQFHTTPVNWRDYIQLPYSTPELPNATLLPKTSVERRVWDHYIDVGWQNGIKQCHAIFINGLGRLNRDTMGMIEYHKLLAKHMISPPFVASAELGTTGDTHHMVLDDQIQRIVSEATLQNDDKQWEPILVMDAAAEEVVDQPPEKNVGRKLPIK